jgi:hypothetical protein
MKKHLAALLIAIMAVSVLSVAGVVTTTTPAAASTGCIAYKSPNPTPTNAPTFSASFTQKVNVRLQVSPALIVRQSSNQIILVTVLYDKKNFDPLMGVPDLKTVRFGHRGTEAAPVASYNNGQGYATSDVNHDGMKDLTFAFSAKDTGLRPFDISAKLTGNVKYVWPSGDNCNTPKVEIMPIVMTGTAFPVFVI